MVAMFLQFTQAMQFWAEENFKNIETTGFSKCPSRIANYFKVEQFLYF
jgi:hypothetical protein